MSARSLAFWVMDDSTLARAEFQGRLFADTRPASLI